MSQLNDAKLAALQTLTGNTGHINDLEAEYLVLLGAAPADILGMWGQVFDAAAIPAGHYNDRWMAYMDSILASAVAQDYNGRELEYWEGGGTPVGPPVPQPPGTPFRWFDFTDGTQVFSDVAGTIPAVDGVLIKRVNNKGTDPQDFIDAASVLEFQTAVVKGRSVARAVTSTAIAAVNAMTAGIAAPGMTVAAVVRATVPVVAGDHAFHQRDGANGNASVMEESGPGWRLGGSAPTINFMSGKGVVANEWVWSYATHGPGGFVLRVSGAAAVNTFSAAFTGLSGGGNLEMGEFKGEIAELLWYSTELSAPELALLIAYFDAKYGVMPFLGVPPTTVNLLHHFDFTRNDTVFKNLPANQPAADGDPIRVVSNLGSDGTALSNPSTGVAPTYKTGIVNGLNVARYDTTFDTLNSVIAAGHLGNTKGLTYAAVFNPRVLVGAGGGPFTKWSDNFRLGKGFGGNNFEGLAVGFGAVFSLGVMTVGQWYLWYMSLDSTATLDRWQLSGEVQQSVVGPPVIDIAPGSIFEIEIASQQFDVAEVGFWDGPLSAGELATLVAYADAKYGTLPHA